MSITERKKNILSATISHYIETAEPVGSKTLTEEYGFEVSPATIRNDLKELENDGYLTQVHTSSGRIPTDIGYRLYVDNLMKQKPLSSKENQQLSRQITAMSKNLTDAFSEVSQIMSSIIDYTTIVLTPDILKESLKFIQLVLVDLDKVLVVLLNSVGVNKEFLLTINSNFSQDDLNKLSQLLSEKLEGKSLKEFDEGTLGKMINALPEYKMLLRSLHIELKRVSVHNNNQKRLLMSGTSNLLKLPEFNNIELTQKVLSTLEESKVLLHILHKYCDQHQDANALIGKETEVNELEDCSLIVSPIQLNDNTAAIGILGPKRMKYSKMLPMVQNISQMVSTYLNEDQSKKGG